ncbi:MAG: CDP-alcohol phosphatidyltransferase family protein [Oscillospiraceae bacterium]|nr:CDP-alcohol phosphatidyltransferase family protein [Oscillospiraceae bacterium]
MKKFFPALRYINVPNIITTIGLVFVISACFYVAEKDLRAVLISLFFAVSMDLLDGFFANKLNQKTRFGQQLDSLTDFFSCCVLPVLILLAFLGNSLLVIAASIFYCTCGMWRLAFYNISPAKKHDYFIGLPVPGGMMFAMMGVWSVVMYGLPEWVCIAAYFAVGLLMISGIRLPKYALWQKVLILLGLASMVVVILS